MSGSMNQEYIDFIKYSFYPEATLPDSAHGIDWADFLNFCNKQGVIGLVFGGMKRSGIKVPQKELFEWLSFAESIKQQNTIVNKRILQLKKFFSDKGYRSIILKGQANGTMYPNPELRSPGDIDIWVEGEDVNIIKLVLKECPGADYSFHHVKMPVFKDVSVEVHYSPVHLTNWYRDKKLQRYIGEIKKDLFAAGILSYEFNLIYQMLHMYHHFFDSRNNFKQFIDYYFLLKKCQSDAVGYLCHTKNTEITERLRDFGVLKYARGVLWIMTDVLGLEKECLYTEPDKKMGSVILSEALLFGTFSQNKLKQVAQQLSGNLRFVNTYPSEVLINPLFLVWHQWWKLKTRMKIHGLYSD